jgi:hypothetical protein
VQDHPQRHISDPHGLFERHLLRIKFRRFFTESLKVYADRKVELLLDGFQNQV